MTVLRRSTLDRGQATVEFALVLPLFALLIVTLADVSVIMRDQMLADVLARNSARRASTARTRDEIRLLVTETLSESGRRDADWSVDIDESAVTVRVEIEPHTSLFASTTKWLSGRRVIAGIATFATEYEITDE
ncbi:MAG: hypothetical protein RL072_1792 [Actinomycetota bacterium]|jgi:Flp pilus assembly protein TadG